MPQIASTPEYEMSEEMREIEADLLRQVEELVIEDDEPVDNIFSEKQQRLLTDALYSSWTGPLDDQGHQRKFTALANVGLFPAIHQKPLVPDVLLSLDVVPKDLSQKRNRSYLLWEFGKLPEIVIEIVSNKKGGERSTKLTDYARINIPYYVVFDPMQQLGDETLVVYEWQSGRYVRHHESYLPLIQLGLTLWQGTYQDLEAEWLRWCDADGNLISTGIELAQVQAERADHEAERAEREAERAAQAGERADHEAERAERADERVAQLAAKLRELGIDPDRI